MNRQIKNAQISDTMLGFEDHGIMTALVSLDFGGASQGFGGYALGGAFGVEFIKKVLRVVGVDHWEQLQGQHVRADFDGSKVYRLGNILRDDWFDPAALAQELAANDGTSRTIKHPAPPVGPDDLPEVDS
jgi:hypothetical protein